MLKTISRKQFLSHLTHSAHEDVSTITSIETSLLKKRKYVFRMPKKGSSVVLLVSGGLDSITVWGILMKEFGLHVYPLAINKGEKKYKNELAAVTYFSRYYKKRYPHLFHEPKWVSMGTNDLKIPVERTVAYMHPSVLLKQITREGNMGIINISLGSSLLLPVYAKMYAEYINYVTNSTIHTIFNAVTISDGIAVPHQTFTAQRAIMYYLCTTTGDYRWQFTSAVFEKELGLYYDKPDLIRWASQHGIPLEKTWTCSFGGTYQCGGSDCLTCLKRRESFRQAHVQDKTIYRPYVFQSFFGRIKYTLICIRDYVRTL